MHRKQRTWVRTCDAANKAAENGRVRAATTVGLMSLLLLMQFVTFLIRSLFFLTALLEKEPKITVTLCWIPGGASGKESVCQCRRHKRHGLDPWVGKISWRRTWQTHSSILAWRIPWREEPGGLQSIDSQGVRHDRSNSMHAHGLIPLPPCFPK